MCREDSPLWEFVCSPTETGISADQKVDPNVLETIEFRPDCKSNSIPSQMGTPVRDRFGEKFRYDIPNAPIHARIYVRRSADDGSF